MKAAVFGKKTHHFHVIDSTNDEAVRRAKEGGEEGEVFIADHQTAGRGRMGRSWDSPKGKNLYISFLLKPPLPPSEAVPLTLVACAALLEALVPFLPPHLRSGLKIKEPNDLYFEDKKIAGILTESASKGDAMEWVVSGIGVNLNVESGDFSPELRETATSFRIITGEEIDRTAFTAKLIESFERRYLEFLGGTKCC